MKLSKILTIAAAALAIAACGPKVEGSKEVVDLLPKASQVDSASYLIGINFGSWIKGNNFGELNYSEVVKGIKDFMNAKGDQRDTNFVKQFKISPMEMQEVLDSYLSKRRDYTAALNKEKAEAFFAENAQKDSVQVTESGLQYKIIEPGSELKPVNDKDTVWVNYKGTLLNGNVFDESDGEPVRLFLNRVVKGWSEGLKLIGEGGKIQLFIPSDLGYGEYGTRGIEPNSALIFDVELTKVGTFVEKPEEPAKGKKK